MKRRDIHLPYDFFEYVRLEDSVPAADRSMIDVALLDMNHSWPNVGHDSIVHAVLEIAEELRDELVPHGMKVRVLSYDVRRRLMIPDSPNGRHSIYLGTGGPGHLDPRENDGVKEFSQGIAETTEWEAPLFHLFDDIMAKEDASLFAICHTFGLMCRWSGIAHPELRDEKSSGMPVNVLSKDGAEHPHFARFGAQLEDGRTFRVVDNRLFDLAWDGGRNAVPIAFEGEGSRALTMVELARDEKSMPRILGVNHHPEIIDRDHIMQVLDEKRQHGEVSDKWYREREVTMRELFQGENERQSRLTSRFTFLEPLRHRLATAIQARRN
jgi:hypothetical protein